MERPETWAASALATCPCCGGCPLSQHGHPVGTVTCPLHEETEAQRGTETGSRSQSWGAEEVGFKLRLWGTGDKILGLASNRLCIWRLKEQGGSRAIFRKRRRGGGYQIPRGGGDQDSQPPAPPVQYSHPCPFKQVQQMWRQTRGLPKGKKNVSIPLALSPRLKAFSWGGHFSGSCSLP